MPQLIPFYFINEVTFTFTIITITVYFLSKYIFPRLVCLFYCRTFIDKIISI
jgi:F-type H+-transporting ATPase subunit 8